MTRRCSLPPPVPVLVLRPGWTSAAGAGPQYFQTLLQQEAAGVLPVDSCLLLLLDPRLSDLQGLGELYEQEYMQTVAGVADDKVGGGLLRPAPAGMRSS
jgi:hypothetical protein